MSTETENPRFFATTHCTFKVSDSLTLRICSNANPQNLKIANLQKGLILLCDGADVVGEGTGFGIPIAKYSDETIFPGSSILYVRRNGNLVEIRKEFFMDLIIRDRFWNLQLENPEIRMLFDYFSALYQRHRRFARTVLVLKSLLLKLGIKSSFIGGPDRGIVAATYILDQKRILVKLDFSQLVRTNLRKVFVLNEQGAHFFRAYSDSEGVRLVDEEIGFWDNVTAKSAKIANEQKKIGFSLKRIEGTSLRQGRELMKDSLDWVGLDYEVDPECNYFEYEIELFG